MGNGLGGGHRSPLYQRIRQCTIRYDTRCYFNVRVKADTSQLNLQHGNEDLQKSEVLSLE